MLYDNVSRTSSLPSTPQEDFNSLPRSRTRIKTNPWLKSPLVSPCSVDNQRSNSFTVSLTGSNRPKHLDLQKTHLKHIQTPIDSTDSMTDSAHFSDASDYYDVPPKFYQTPTPRYTSSRSFYSPSEGKNFSKEEKVYEEIPADRSSPVAVELPRSYGITDFQQALELCDSMRQLSPSTGPIYYSPTHKADISFEYEDDFESRIEDDLVPPFRKLVCYQDDSEPLFCPSIPQLDTSPASSFEEHQKTTSCTQYEHDSLFSPPTKGLHLRLLHKVFTASGGDDSTGTDDTLCGGERKNKKYKHRQEQRVRRRFSYSKTPEVSTQYSNIEDDNDADAEDNKEESISLADESFDSAIDSSMSTSDSPSIESRTSESDSRYNENRSYSVIPNGKYNNHKVDRVSTYDAHRRSERSYVVHSPSRNASLSDGDDGHFYKNHKITGHVTESLEQRVERLRQEKNIVDGKIREAREEEVVRQRERQRLHKEAALQRKALLLDTLQELKGRLEGQSERLQNAYVTVLNMQNVIRFQNRTSTMKHVATTCTNEELLF